MTWIKTILKLSLLGCILLACSGKSDDDNALLLYALAENAAVGESDSLSNTVWHGCAKSEFFGEKYTLDIGLCTNNSPAYYYLKFFDENKFKYIVRDAHSMTVNGLPIQAAKILEDEGTYIINGAKVEGKLSNGNLVFLLTLSGGKLILTDNDFWYSFYYTYRPNFATEFLLLRVGEL